MKRFITMSLLGLLAIAVVAQTNPIKGPVKVRYGTSFITLNVTDSTLISLNDKIKLYQKADTLLVIAGATVIAKLAEDEVWFYAGLAETGGQVFETVRVDTLRWENKNVKVYSSANNYTDGGKQYFGTQFRNDGSNNFVEILPRSRSIVNDAGIGIALEPTRIRLFTSTDEWYWNGSIFYSDADTLATQDYSRDHGGSFSGTVPENEVAIGDGSGGLTTLYQEDGGGVVKLHTDNLVLKSEIELSGDYAGFDPWSFQLYTDGTMRMYLYPTIPNAAGNVAYLFDTETALTGNAIVASFKNNGVTRFYIKNDTIVSLKRFAANDSLQLTYLNGSATGSRFPVITSTGALDSGTLVNQGRMLYERLPCIWKHLSDTHNGEASWYYEDDHGVIQKSYGIDLSPEGIAKLQSGIEMSWRWIFRRLIEDMAQWIAILSIAAFAVYSHKLKR